MRVLVTGITGMVGSHLADYVLREHPGTEVHGLVRWRSPRAHVQHLAGRVTLHEGELRDRPRTISARRAACSSTIHDHAWVRSCAPFPEAAPERSGTTVLQARICFCGVAL